MQSTKAEGTPCVFHNVQLLKTTDENGDGESIGCSKQFKGVVAPAVRIETHNVVVLDGDKELSKLPLEVLTAFPLTKRAVAVRLKTMESNDSDDSGCLVVRFACEKDARHFCSTLSEYESTQTKEKQKSIFERRTDESSAVQYFQFYGYLSQQQNMMQDYVRTSTYQRAIVSNMADFKNKVVLDVGAGSGILSFFAIQAGARKVYAVEASSMAEHCQALVSANNLSDKITVVAGKVEDIDLPELADVIISEPMGYMLVNERMLETYLHAKKFLKPNGKMYPTRGDVHLAPFTDEALYLEQTGKAAFWCQDSFHGVHLSSLRPHALQEYFKQPVVDTWHVGILLAESQPWTIDFQTANEQDLHNIEIPFDFVLSTTALVHGLAFWFDVAFIGTNQTVWLSTSPTEPLTHWYQVRCLIEQPLLGRQGDHCAGIVKMTANNRQSYDVEIEMDIDGKRSRSTLDLKNPYFRYTGQPVQPPPGTHGTSPTEQYWQQQQTTISNHVGASAATNGYLQPQAYTGDTVGMMMNGGGSISPSFHPGAVGGGPNIMDMLLNAQVNYQQQQQQRIASGDVAMVAAMNAIAPTATQPSPHKLLTASGTPAPLFTNSQHDAYASAMARGGGVLTSASGGRPHPSVAQSVTGVNAPSSRW